MPCLSSLFIIRDFIHQLDQIKMKRNKGRRGKRNIQLPHELIIEILLRLPVKSLVRFKCVCKSWLSLISDPHFETSHFDLTTGAHIHRLIFIAKKRTRAIDFQVSLSEAAATVSLNLNFLLPQSYLSLQIGGSCRGFLFLHCNQNIYLWNPSTGIHKQIHWPPIVSDVDNRFFYTYLYGFGYDSSTDDYLVVLGSYDPKVTDGLTHLEFFSLRANPWKEIEGAHFPYARALNNPQVGTLFNGAIHWLARRADMSVNVFVVIVVFDLTERRISEITLPDFCNFYHEPCGSYDLCVFGGLKSLSTPSMEELDVIEIWVMKEYGVYSSWTKTLLVLHTVFFYPICSTSCGDIVGYDGRGGLVKYNDNGQLLEHGSYCFQMDCYTESLLPLPLPRDTQQA